LISPDFDPEQAVILSERLPDITQQDAGSSSADDSVVIEEQGSNEYRFRIETGSAGVLVVSQIYYPGWRATIDGERVRVLDANYALTGIPVPAGSHSVRLTFAPGSFIAGLAITTLSALLLGVLLLRLDRDSHRRGS
jgi:uncharacterized membrane protein YfhO